MAIELTGTGQVDTTYSAIGPNTDPTAMPASGSALYNGTVNAVLQPSINPSTQVSEFSGAGSFHVDFTANTVSGSMVYTQSSDTQFTQGSSILTVTLPSTSITGNTFETTQAPRNSTRRPAMARASAPCALRVISLAKQAPHWPAASTAQEPTAAATPLICKAGLWPKNRRSAAA